MTIEVLIRANTHPTDISSVSHPYLSIFIPAHDEAGNIPPLVERVAQALDQMDLTSRAELIIVDDGSTDTTWEEIQAAASRYPWVRALRHRRNLGLTAAMSTGFSAARGEIIAFLPADLESDPVEDLPKLVAKIEEGYDVVAGWRQGRKEGKVVASRIYNLVSRYVFGVNAHDMNWIKAFRREVIDTLPPLRSDWHRFILMIAAHQGYRIGEVKVRWHRRRAGRSKFGIERIPISFLDALVVKFLLTFSQAPMRFFGMLGLASLTVSGTTFIYLAYLWFSRGKQQRPIFWAAGVLALAGLLLILVGFLAELVVNQQEHLSRLERRVEALEHRLPQRVEGR